MTRLHCIFLIFLITSICSQSLSINEEDDNINRIVGGALTTINNAKYMVSLRDSSGRVFCGGSLVGSRFVVTAAHCIEGMKATNIVVHGGVTYLNEEGVKRTVARMVKPKMFNTRTLMNDVAVLKLNGPMIGTNIATIPLCSRRLKTNSWVQVFGWGQVRENASNQSNQLRVAGVRITERNKCVQSYANELKITKSMFCASVAGISDSCIGDSGGPLVYRGQLCGIVSFGVGCARTNFPGVYTSINAVKGLIKKAMA